MTDITDVPQPPDLQEWIAKYGSYTSFPWAEWDAAMAEWRQKRKQMLEDEIWVSRSIHIRNKQP